MGNHSPADAPCCERGVVLNPIRTLLADDHGIVRQGLRAVLTRDPRIEVVGESADGLETVSLAETLDPDIVIMDITMPHLNGIEATARITKRSPKTGVVILSMHSDETYVLRALNAGARGYLLKDSAEVDLTRAVEAVARGKTFFSAAVTRTLLEDYVRNIQQRHLTDSYDLLTDRKRKCCSWWPRVNRTKKWRRCWTSATTL
jgi:DNA-binding NarL/FixJ family response regulator